MTEKYEDYTIELPDEVSNIIHTIEENGLQAYAVGGCIRDSLLGKSPDDWDITTSAVPAQIKSFFKKTVDTGIAHGTVTVMFGKNGYEVTTYRIDGDYEDGRHPKSVEFSVLLSDDLCRRDFTINAMAYNEASGLIDNFDGIGDLERKLIRCVGNPNERFMEDALRMMRAIRFCAQLGFEIESKTRQAIVNLAPNIRKVSMERVHTELGKTLLSDNPDYCIFYVETGLFKDILPALYNSLKGKYAKKALLTARYIKKELILRYVALFSGCTPENAEASLRALKLDNRTITMVPRILRLSKEKIDEKEPAMRRIMHKYGKDLIPYLFEFMQADIQAAEELTSIHSPSRHKHLITLKRLYKRIIERGDCFCLETLNVNGNDLMKYGLKGEEIGKTLNALLEIVIENPPLNEKGTLIALIENL